MELQNSSPEPSFPVFVYGTLMKGMPNEAKNEGKFLGNYSTKGKYNLSLVGKRYSVWLVQDQRRGSQVRGELYAVTSAQLATMDDLERVGAADGYIRRQIEVIDGKKRDLGFRLSQDTKTNQR